MFAESVFSLVGLAALLGLGTAVGLVITTEWRLLLLLLLGQYALLGVVLTSFLPLHLAYINFVVGLFVGLILLVTVWQLPTSARRLGAFLSGRRAGGALLLTAVGGLLAWWLAADFWLNWLMLGLLFLGLLRFLTTAVALPLGIGFLLLLSSFQLFYLHSNQSPLMVAFFALAHLLSALATAYLMQWRTSQQTLSTE